MSGLCLSLLFSWSCSAGVAQAYQECDNFPPQKAVDEEAPDVSKVWCIILELFIVEVSPEFVLITVPPM